MAGKKSTTAKIREQDYVALVPKMVMNGMGHLPWPSVLSPSGLAPVMCDHGLRTLPAGHPPFRREPSYSADGGELPAFGGNSWVRAKYANGNFKCAQCTTGIRPDDLTESREAISG